MRWFRKRQPAPVIGWVQQGVVDTDCWYAVINDRWYPFGSKEMARYAITQPDLVPHLMVASPEAVNAEKQALRGW